MSQPDSNLAVHPGSSGTVEGEVLWSTKSRPVVGVFFMELQDDGKLAIYRGSAEIALVLVQLTAPVPGSTQTVRLPLSVMRALEL